MSTERPAGWLAFARASVAIGLTAGFGLGALLFASLIVAGSPGLWRPAAAQAHGHAQLYGWAGLMVLGVGLHFLPRLASVPAIPAGAVRRAFWLLAAGLAGRVIGQPALAMSDASTLRFAFGAAWALGAVAEMLGSVLLVMALGRAFKAARPLRSDAAIRPVVPFFALAFLSLPALLAGGAFATLRAALDGDALLPHQTSTNLALVTMYAFLTPVSVAMSARLFPLYLRTRPARLRLLQAGLTLLLAGLALRLIGEQRALADVEQAGRLLLLLAAAGFVSGLAIFEPRRQLPRRQARLWRDALGLHALAAYIWQLAAGSIQFLSADRLDAELHLLGAGFISLLILGMGPHLLAGFSGRPARGPTYSWLTLIAGNLATVLRLIPTLPFFSPSGTMDRIFGTAAGIAGLFALACFALNLSSALGFDSVRHAGERH